MPDHDQHDERQQHPQPRQSDLEKAPPRQRVEQQGQRQCRCMMRRMGQAEQPHRRDTKRRQLGPRGPTVGAGLNR